MSLGVFPRQGGSVAGVAAAVALVSPPARVSPGHAVQQRSKARVLHVIVAILFLAPFSRVTIFIVSCQISNPAIVTKPIFSRE